MVQQSIRSCVRMEMCERVTYATTTTAVAYVFFFFIRPILLSHKDHENALSKFRSERRRMSCAKDIYAYEQVVRHNHKKTCERKKRFYGQKYMENRLSVISYVYVQC